MRIYIDEALPESCSKCGFLVHCCECEGYENYCPFIGDVGYDLSDDLKDGAPITPTWERHEECPLVQMPHGEWKQVTAKDGEYYCYHKCTNCGQTIESGFDNPPIFNFCPNCGADMRKEGEANDG